MTTATREAETMTDETKSVVVETTEVKTSHGTLTLAAKTAFEFNGKRYYRTHEYNSLGQEITGGFTYPVA